MTRDTLSDTAKFRQARAEAGVRGTLENAAFLAPKGEAPLSINQEVLAESTLVNSAYEQSLRQLAGGVAHDFNNLLTAILGNASLMLLDLPDSSPYMPILADIVQAAQRAADLADQMLAFAGRRHMDPQVMDLSFLIKDLGERVRAGLTDKIDIRLDCPPGGLFIKADPTHIKQLFYNLLGNAREALPEWGGHIHIRLREETLNEAQIEALNLYMEELRPGSFAALSVHDDGTGMDDDVVKRIFDPFFSTKFTGRGLGMSVVRGIIESHGGALAITSNPGAGTRITAYFPLLISAQ